MCVEYLIALIILICFIATAFISLLGWMYESKRREASDNENKELLIYVTELEQQNTRLRTKLAIIKFNKENEKNEGN